MSNSITTRLILLLTGCLAAIFATGMLLDYRLSRDEILARLRLQSEETVRSAVTDMENWLKGVENSTRLLARVLERSDYSGEGLEQLLKDVVENNDAVFGAAIALNPVLVPDPQGFAPYYYRRDGILEYSDLAAEQYNYPNQPWFTEPVAAGQPVWAEPYFDEGGGEILMTTFAVPVYRLDKTQQRFLYAVVTADVPLAELHNYLLRLRLGESGEAFLLSRTGIVLSSRHGPEILHHYSDIVPGETDLAAWRAMFHSALSGQPASRQLQCPDIPGSCVMRFGLLRPTGWPVGISYSEREMLAPLHRFQLKTLLLGCATLLLMALAVFFVTRRLTRPLAALAGASDEIARGRLDAPLPRIRGRDEVARLIHSFGAMQGDLKHYIADLEAATASRSRLEGELNAAREIQMSLLPHGGEASERFAGCELWARVRPARIVGGDLYSYRADGQRLLLAVGDVSDKGVPAALFMAKAISLIPQLAEPDSDPGAALARLNDALAKGNDNCMFVTLFLGILDLNSRQLHFASAGHAPPSLLRDGSVRSLEQLDGPALGLATGLQFPDNLVQLLPGDRLAIYTDGVDEAFDDRGVMFGMERLHRQLVESGNDSPAGAGAQLFRAIDAFAGATPQSDDIALLLLQVDEDDAGKGRSMSGQFHCGDGLTGRVLRWLQARLDQVATTDEAARELLLVAEEIVSNIDRHAGLPQEGVVEITLESHPGRLELVVMDRGRPFNPLQEARRASLGEGIESAGIGGLGVHLITRLTDRQSYRRSDGCNILRVAKLERTDGPPDVNTTTQHGREARINMELNTTVFVDAQNSVARVNLDGALNTDTAPAFEQRLQQVFAEGHRLTVLDMKELDYISSAGLRVIFKAAKQCKAAGNRLAAANRKPHIDKVFEILKALPDMTVFANEAELDDYLQAMQSQVRGD